MFQKQCDKRLKLYKQMSFTIFHNGEEMKKRKAKATGKAKAKQKVIEFSLIDDED